MHARALTTLPGLAVLLLLTGCGHDNRIVVRDPLPTTVAEPMFVDQPLPTWHPALPEGHPPVPGMGLALPEGHPPVLPEGHPPISGAECPPGDMSGFGDTPSSAQPVPETIST